jgi:hypothetical protein
VLVLIIVLGTAALAAVLFWGFRYPFFTLLKDKASRSFSLTGPVRGSVHQGMPK